MILVKRFFLSILVQPNGIKCTYGSVFGRNMNTKVINVTRYYVLLVLQFRSCCPSSVSHILQCRTASKLQMMLLFFYKQACYCNKNISVILVVFVIFCDMPFPALGSVAHQTTSVPHYLILIKTRINQSSFCIVKWSLIFANCQPGLLLYLLQ